MTDEELTAIEQRVQAASPGPWTWEAGTGENLGGWRGPDELLLAWFGNAEQYYPTEGEEPNEADQQFIAHARTDVPALLAEVRRLQVENHKLEEWKLALEDVIRRERARPR